MRRVFAVAAVAAAALTSTYLVDDDSSFDHLSTTDRPVEPGDLPTSRAIDDEPPDTGIPDGDEPDDTSPSDATGPTATTTGPTSPRPDATSITVIDPSGPAGTVHGPGQRTDPDGGTGQRTSPTTSTDTTSTSPSVPPTSLDPDQIHCPQLATVAIGTWDPAAPGQGVLADASRRLRAALPMIQAAAPDNRYVVCGTRVLEAWRGDILTQGLVAGPTKIGTLITGRGSNDPAILASPMEWKAWGWLRGGDTELINYAGTPLQRDVLDGVPIIRTSTGAVVSARPDAPAYAVVGGAWTYWMDHGGPAGPMGLPTTYATDLDDAAVQGFEHGMLRLPGVTSAHEALAAPASAYEWHGFADAPPAIAATPNSLVEYRGASYYVDRDLRRHWIRTTGGWNCARYDLRARRIGEIDIVSMAAIPEGAAFSCPR